MVELTYDGLVSDQVVTGRESLWDDVCDAVTVTLHVCLGGPFLPTSESLFVDGEPLQRIQIGECRAIIIRTGSHVDRQRSTVVWPRSVPASTDGPSGCDCCVCCGGASGVVANGLGATNC